MRALRTLLKRLIDNRLIYFRVKGGPKQILLTFDDGPHATQTPQILDLLDRYEAKAVFFLIGERAEKHPEIVREILRRGHTLGNHSYSHLNEYRGGTASYAQYKREILRCRELIRSIAGYETDLFRPPRGEVTWKSMLATLVSRHRTIYWSLEGGEWGCRSDKSAVEIAEYVSEHVRGGDILLFHDDYPQIIEVMESVLAACAERSLDMSRASLARAATNGA